MAEIAFADVTKRFDDGTVAVDGVSMEVGDGEFMVLVGPSGSGKTTMMRMVAGLEELSGGTICDRRPRRQRHPGPQPQRRDGLPELRALPAHERR